jgi:protein-disulfide isomerase
MRRTALTPAVWIGLLTLTALATSSLALWRELDRRRGQPPGLRPVPTSGDLDVATWRAMTETAWRDGPRNAATQVLVFFSYDCPACGALQRAIDSVRSRYPGEIGVYYRHFLPRGAPRADTAALIAECAAMQGAFAHARRTLLAAEPRFDTVIWSAVIEGMPVSSGRALRRCIDRHEVADRVRGDLRLAATAGVASAPAVFVNGRRYSGRMDAASLSRVAVGSAQ